MNRQLKIVSWNLNRNNYISTQACLSLGKMDFDIICLQEVSHDSLQKIRVHFIGYEELVAKEVISTRGNNLELYLVTLVKGGIVKVGVDSLTPTRPPIYRLINRSIKIEFSFVDVNIQGSKLRVFNCHLQYAASPSIRISQLEHLLSKFIDNGNYHNIVCGDLNTIGKLSLSFLGPLLGYKLKDYKINEEKYINSIGGFFNAHEKMNTVIYKTGQLDYILTPRSFKSIESKVLTKNRFGSDHYPITVIVVPA